MVGGDAHTWNGRRSDGTEAIAQVVGHFIEGSTQVRETCYWTAWRFWSSWPCLFRERRRIYVLWHAWVDEQHRSLPDTKRSEDTAGQSQSVLETGASDAAGAVSTGAGPHANANGAPPHLRSQR